MSWLARLLGRQELKPQTSGHSDTYIQAQNPPDKPSTQPEEEDDHSQHSGHSGNGSCCCG